MPSAPEAAQQLLTTVTNEVEADDWRVRAFTQRGTALYIGATCGGDR